MMLLHCCKACRLNDLETRGLAKNSGKNVGDNGLTCVCGSRAFDLPQIVPSFTHTGRRIERLAPPGTTVAGTLKTCRCKDCKTAYDQHVDKTGAAA